MSEFPTPSFNRSPIPLEAKEAGQKNLAVASRWKRLFWNRGVIDPAGRNNEEFHGRRDKIQGARLLVQWIRNAAARQTQRVRSQNREVKNDSAKEAYARQASALAMAQYAINLSVRYEGLHEQNLGRKGQS